MGCDIDEGDAIATVDAHLTKVFLAGHYQLKSTILGADGGGSSGVGSIPIQQFLGLIRQGQGRSVDIDVLIGRRRDNVCPVGRPRRSGTPIFKGTL